MLDFPTSRDSLFCVKGRVSKACEFAGVRKVQV